MDTILYKASVTAVTTIVLVGLYKVFKRIHKSSTSPLRNIPGPSSPSLIFGNLKQIFAEDNSIILEKWVEKYGNVVKLRGFLGENRLFTTDTVAINYILSHTDIYQKPEMVRYNMSTLVGSGILLVEGDKHRQQRRIMNPAFGPVQVRALTSIIVAKAVQLRDILSAEIAEKQTENVSSESVVINEKTSYGGFGDKGLRINVLSWLNRTTLDVIGLAGFNYHFDALNATNVPNELNQAFTTVFKTVERFSILRLLKVFLPPFRVIVTPQDRAITTARQTMNRIGSTLLTNAKASVSATSKSDTVEKNDIVGRDLLSLLVKANMATDVKEEQKLSDEEVLAQIPTFLVAGHETTSIATAWALYALSIDHRIQSTLRDELISVPTETPTMDELNALPYLDAVVRETLRIHSPIANSARVAMRDDTIPVGKVWNDKKGVEQLGIQIRKGERIIIPIVSINRSKELWGENANEFKPERWQNLPEAVSAIPGVWANLLTFLGGPRACIGYRFSLIEIKSLLFTLVRAFEFELAVPASQIAKKQSIVQRPVVISEREVGNQMPVLIKPYAGG